MPSSILGAVPDAAMNLVYPLGIFASVQKAMGGKVEFPCDLRAWEVTRCLSTSKLNAWMEEWAVLNGDAADQRFNTSDDCSFTWGGFWPKFAGWYGMGFETPRLEDEVYTTVTSRFETPPRGFGPKGVYRYRYRLTEWAKREDVQRTWEELVDKHGLVSKRLQDMDVDRIFGFTDQSLLGTTLDLTMSKARKMGWHGFVDSNDAIKEVLDEFVDLKMIPPMRS